MSSDSSDSSDSSYSSDEINLDEIERKYGDMDILKDIIWHVCDEVSDAKKLKHDNLSNRLAALFISHVDKDIGIEVYDNEGNTPDIFEREMLDKKNTGILTKHMKLMFQTEYVNPSDNEKSDWKKMEELYSKTETIECEAKDDYFTLKEVLTYIYDFYQSHNDILKNLERSHMKFKKLRCYNWPPIDEVPVYRVSLSLF